MEDCLFRLLFGPKINVLSPEKSFLNAHTWRTIIRIHFLGNVRVVEIVELLLNAGADVNAETTQGETPRDFAVDISKIFDFINLG